MGQPRPVRRGVIRDGSTGSITGVRCTSPVQSTLPSGPAMRATIRGATRSPPLANGAYAVTSSIGVTSAAPNTTAGTAGSGLTTPLRCAVAMIAGSPTRCATRTVAPLAECASASRSVVSPR